jgi:hypothetical protein
MEPTDRTAPDAAPADANVIDLGAARARKTKARKRRLRTLEQRLRANFHQFGVQVDEEILTDPDWQEKLKGTWRIEHGYAVRSNTDGTKSRLHRLLMGVGPGEGIIDHIDRNPLNNKRSNLRLATTRENNLNRSPQRNNTSGHTGVDFLKAKNRYRVRYRGKQVGLFRTEEEAIAARSHAEASDPEWQQVRAPKTDSRMKEILAHSAATLRLHAATLFPCTGPTFRVAYDPSWRERIEAERRAEEEQRCLARADAAKAAVAAFFADRRKE